ncbi:uncharacterized protein EV420DRAFT_401930 [Desarmillaria tabescens]|uniref:Uncharacterized protein n=1 Tax=Armillaria tabescens TaxID=1929756 RepID=A0AA39N599_ARMTA|nr:uncharacterized protein EV420DRAFT_401930 [Desarmillaria tabescens]KAK0457938.1 hypothetical protein EV420DRAFT_401930 [Desarmillaria tabescens]
MAARHPYPPMPYPTDPFGIYAFMARIDARLDRIENQMEATGLSLGYLVTRIDEIEERLESIEDNNQGIENKIIDMDSRFDDIDSKLEDIDMEALTEGIDGVVRESLEELNLDAVERMAAINHNTNIYRAIRDAGNPDLWGDIILVEVPFPGGREAYKQSPTSP